MERGLLIGLPPKTFQAIMFAQERIGSATGEYIIIQNLPLSFWSLNVLPIQPTSQNTKHRAKQL